MDKSVNEAEKILAIGFEKIAEFGDHYVTRYLDELLKEKGLSKESILDDWWHAFQFFCGKCFYQGRRDQTSRTIEKNTLEILEDFLGETIADKEDKITQLQKDGHLDLRHLNGNETLKEYHLSLLKHNKILQKLVERKKGRDRDRLMVLNLMSLMINLPDKNLVKYFKQLIEEENIERAYIELKTVISIKDKIASLILRDIVLLYNLEDKVSEITQVFIQPIDTWLKKIALAMMNKKLKELKVSAAKFNAGAWYYSTK